MGLSHVGWTWLVLLLFIFTFSYQVLVTVSRARPSVRALGLTVGRGDERRQLVHGVIDKSSSSVSSEDGGEVRRLGSAESLDSDSKWGEVPSR